MDFRIKFKEISSQSAPSTCPFDTPLCFTEDSPARVSATFHKLQIIVFLLSIWLLPSVLREVEGPGRRL